MDLTAQQALDLAEIERDRYREMRRKVLEEAARSIKAVASGYSLNGFNVAAVALECAAADIRALATSDPPEPQLWRDTLGPEDRYESNKGPANG